MARTMEYLGSAELAARIGKSPRWVVSHLLATGELPAFRLGASWRVRPCDYERWAEERARRAQEPVLESLPRVGRARAAAGV